MRYLRLFGIAFAVLLVHSGGVANAALVGRMPLTPGGTDYQAAYDTVLDITWVTNASLSGARRWDQQVAWADSLNGSNFLGFDSGWRLAYSSVASGPNPGPVVNCSTATEVDCRDNELGYMFYYNLAASPGPDSTGTITIGDVTLTDIQVPYWSGTEHSSGLAWYFRYDSGLQFSVSKYSFDLFGWAVRDGDAFAPVPLPAGVWLFSTALLCLMSWNRKRSN